MGVPKRLRLELYSHMARPHPYLAVTWSMWATMPSCISGHRRFAFDPGVVPLGPGRDVAGPDVDGPELVDGPRCDEQRREHHQRRDGQGHERHHQGARRPRHAPRAVGDRRVRARRGGRHPARLAPDTLAGVARSPGRIRSRGRRRRSARHVESPAIGRSALAPGTTWGAKVETGPPVANAGVGPRGTARPGHVGRHPPQGVAQVAPSPGGHDQHLGHAVAGDQVHTQPPDRAGPACCRARSAGANRTKSAATTPATTSASTARLNRTQAITVPTSPDDRAPSGRRPAPGGRWNVVTFCQPMVVL